MARRSRARYRGTAIVVIILLFGLVTVPLAITSIRLQKVREIEDCLRQEVNQSQSQWKTHLVVARGEGGHFTAKVTVVGEPPFPTEDELPDDLTERCDVDVIQLSFLPLFDYVV